MTSVELEFDEKSHAVAMFMAEVAREIRRAAVEEKARRKITQQAIADKVGTSRAVINREMSGLENLTARRIAEILWALGWEPHFEARKNAPR
jgi:cyanate lyase